jgi:hypothetical protein
MSIGKSDALIVTTGSISKSTAKCLGNILGLHSINELQRTALLLVPHLQW